MLLSREDHSSCLQESLILTPQRWGTHSSTANCAEGGTGRRGAMGMVSKPLSLQGASVLSPVLTACSRSPDCSFSSARLRFLLLICCLQGPYCLLPPGRTRRGGSQQCIYAETKHFPAGIEGLSILKPSLEQGIFA